MTHRAIARISVATGLEFEDDGDTERRRFAGSFLRLGGAAQDSVTSPSRWS